MQLAASSKQAGGANRGGDEAAAKDGYYERSDQENYKEEWMPRTVEKYTCRTPHFHMDCHCTDDTAQMTCVHGSRS